jgi:lipoprotein-anchoring transpeptidase ErfK/SrfK
MRFLRLAGCLFLAATHIAKAEGLTFPPNTFVILGAMDTPTQVAMPVGKRGSLLQSGQADDLSGPDRATIEFPSTLPPGSILVRTGERKLYYILPGGQAIMYRVGVGREGFSWSGSNRISRKAEWPSWRPLAEMIAREAQRGQIIPDFMPGGPQNPLGARALYIGDTEFRIHGTTQPWTIGHAVSSGCIRMLNEHVIDLFNRVDVGAEVVVE